MQQAGLTDRFHIDSAGTSGYHNGEGPDPRTCAVAERRGVLLEHASRRLRRADIEQFHYILAMDADNLAGIEAHATKVASADPEINLLRAYDPDSPPGAEVPDPYFDGERGFEEVHDIIERACRGLLQHIRTEHSV